MICLTFSSPATGFFLGSEQKCLFLQFGFMIALLFSIYWAQAEEFVPPLQEPVRYLEVATVSPLRPCSYRLGHAASFHHCF